MTFNYLATSIFACAIIHTFLAGKFNKLAHKYPVGSMQENIFHFLGEIEVVFGLWLFPLFYAYIFVGNGYHETIKYFDKIDMTEPLFVIVIMVMASTRPVLNTAKKMVAMFSNLIPLPSKSARFYFSILAITPLLGSFITEPAAMTICALLIGNYFFIKNPSPLLKYATIGLLFVNISIGGTLTHFAAPPVLMVASKWEFDLVYMFTHFGWKAIIATMLGAFLISLFHLKEFKELDQRENPLDVEEVPVPWWVVLIHLFSLAWTVYFVHHPILFAFGFLFFLGWCAISQEFQDEINIKPALLVGFFLAGLKVHGELQEWWIKPLIERLDEWPLFIGSTILTAFNDNAAITYLSTFAFPEGFSPEGTMEFLKKYAVVAGAVTGGGLTVIANAPNPAGNSILKGYFGEEGVSPIKLFLAALPPTILAAACFMLL